MLYLWLKALHIIAMVCWFAGLFYLPRLFVNLAMVPPGSVAERERLLRNWKKAVTKTLDWVDDDARVLAGTV